MSEVVQDEEHDTAQHKNMYDGSACAPKGGGGGGRKSAGMEGRSGAPANTEIPKLKMLSHQVVKISVAVAPGGWI